MGLDMYLKASKYIGGFRHSDDTEKAMLDAVLTAANIPKARLSTEHPSIEVQVTVVYWRKCWEIHNWFVRECQDGIDECRRTYVDRVKLETLIKECKCILETSQDEDSRYQASLTITLLTPALESPALKGCSFYYQSSW